MLMPYPCIKWPEAVELNSQTVHAVCEGVQAPHGKVETLCHGAQVVDALSKDNAPPGMTPLEWCHAQAQDPIITQIIGGNRPQNNRKDENQHGDAFRIKGPH